MLAKGMKARRMTMGAHTTGTESIIDEMQDDS